MCTSVDSAYYSLFLSISEPEKGGTGVRKSAHMCAEPVTLPHWKRGVARNAYRYLHNGHPTVRADPHSALPDISLTRIQRHAHLPIRAYLFT